MSILGVEAGIVDKVNTTANDITGRKSWSIRLSRSRRTKWMSIIPQIYRFFMGIPDSSKHSAILDNTIAITWSLGDSLPLLVDYQHFFLQDSISQPSQRYTATFFTYSFYSSDNASPASPSSLVSTLYLHWSQKKQTWLIEESTLYYTVSDLSKSFVSSETSFKKSEGSSTTSRYSLLWNPLSLQSPSDSTVPCDTFYTTEHANCSSPSILVI